MGQAIGALAALWLLAAPAEAQAADGLECMAESYDAQEREQIAALSTDFRFERGEGSGDQLAQFGLASAYDCFDQNNWSEEALRYATLFEIARLSEAAYRQSGHLTAEQLRLFDQALAARDRTELWAAMERAVLAGLEDRDEQPSPRDEILLGGFILSARLGTEEETSRKVGELMGTMALQRIARREFAALTGGA